MRETPTQKQINNLQGDNQQLLLQAMQKDMPPLFAEMHEKGIVRPRRIPEIHRLQIPSLEGIPFRVQ